MPDFGKQKHESNAAGTLCSVTLVNGRHRWRFTCSSGDRESLISALGRRVGREESDLSAEDAAIVARHLRMHNPSQTTGTGGRSTHHS
ncbi:hypothetical protein JYU07_00115 [Roseiflexus sp. AH-315-K22]|nr:hypothetical protein [Roseiflexus sp. AH-315-K22]